MQTDLLKPKSITVKSLGGHRAEVILEPFERGYGHTLGNALRSAAFFNVGICADPSDYLWGCS